MASFQLFPRLSRLPSVARARVVRIRDDVEMRAPRRPHVSHAPHAEDRVIGPRRIRAIKGGLIVDGIARALIVYFIRDASTGTDGLGQRQEVIVIIKLHAVHAYELPAMRRGNPRRVVFAQVPAVRIFLLAQGTHDGGLLRVGIRERCYGGAAAARTRAVSFGGSLVSHGPLV